MVSDGFSRLKCSRFQKNTLLGEGGEGNVVRLSVCLTINALSAEEFETDV